MAKYFICGKFLYISCFCGKINFTFHVCILYFMKMILFTHYRFLIPMFIYILDDDIEFLHKYNKNIVGGEEETKKNT